MWIEILTTNVMYSYAENKRTGYTMKAGEK